MNLDKLATKNAKAGPFMIASVDDNEPGQTTFTYKFPPALGLPVTKGEPLAAALTFSEEVFVKTAGGTLAPTVSKGGRGGPDGGDATVQAKHPGDKAQAIVFRYIKKAHLVRLPFAFRDVPLPKVRDVNTYLALPPTRGRPVKSLVEANAGSRIEIFDKSGYRLPELPTKQRGSVSIYGTGGQDNYTFDENGIVTKHLGSYGEDFAKGAWVDVE